jgi:hypothetical protein
MTASDDTSLQSLKDDETIDVTLTGGGSDGLGFNIVGNMMQGIYVSHVLNRGPAYESGHVLSGCRLQELTVNMRHMVYEDALTILSYSAAYEVRLRLRKAIPPGRPGSWNPDAIFYQAPPPLPLMVTHASASAAESSSTSSQQQQQQIRRQSKSGTLQHPMFRSLSFDDLLSLESSNLCHHSDLDDVECKKDDDKMANRSLTSSIYWLDERGTIKRNNNIKSESPAAAFRSASELDLRQMSEATTMPLRRPASSSSVTADVDGEAVVGTGSGGVVGGGLLSWRRAELVPDLSRSFEDAFRRNVIELQLVHGDVTHIDVADLATLNRIVETTSSTTSSSSGSPTFPSPSYCDGSDALPLSQQLVEDWSDQSDVNVDQRKPRQPVKSSCSSVAEANFEGGAVPWNPSDTVVPPQEHDNDTSAWRTNSTSPKVQPGDPDGRRFSASPTSGSGSTDSHDSPTWFSGSTWRYYRGPAAATSAVVGGGGVRPAELCRRIYKDSTSDFEASSIVAMATSSLGSHDYDDDDDQVSAYKTKSEVSDLVETESETDRRRRQLDAALFAASTDRRFGSCGSNSRTMPPARPYHSELEISAAISGGLFSAGASPGGDRQQLSVGSHSDFNDAELTTYFGGFHDASPAAVLEQPVYARRRSSWERRRSWHH